VAIDLKLAKVLDLTDGMVRKTLGVSATRMRADDWRKLNRHGAESLTQAIGRAGYESGLEGLMVPACDGGRNVVWFPDNLRGAAKAKIRNAGKLG
jgi:RES domain-containing protein